MNLDLLSTFVAVAETASFSAAAKKLGLPKSSVSRGIAALEAQMGVRLVHRTTRHVSLSTAGTALYERVAGHVAALQKSVGELPESEEQPSGELRITASVDFGVTMLSELVTRFLARYPQIRVDARVTNRKVDLVAEGVDVALRISATERLESSSLVARRVLPVELQLFASPEYLARRGTPRTPDDLATHEWVVFRGGEKVRLSSRGESQTVTATGRLVCDDMFFLKQAVRAGGGIGSLPTFLAEAEVLEGRLSRVLPRWRASSGFLWIVVPEAKHSPRKVTAFRDFLVEALSARPGA